MWLMFPLAFSWAGMLLYTRFGRHMFAIGWSEQAARLCGVRDRREVLVYVLAAAGGGGGIDDFRG